MIFKCKFGGGVSCTMTVSDTIPEPQKASLRNVEWTGVLPKKKRARYIDWMNDTNQFLADKWNLKLMHVYMFDPHLNDVQVWVYEPGKCPRLAM